MNREQVRIIKDRWSEAEARDLSELEMLVYQSQLVGSDAGLVVWGGGNTSLKVVERDFRGRETLVLRVKGSGSDLKAVKASDFPGVRMEDVLPLLEKESMSDEEMVEYLSHTLMEPGSPRPSIETLLHAFVPARSIVHSHADAILALTNNSRATEMLAEVYGDDLAVIPYQRPGFSLSKQVGEAARHNPSIKGVILLNHGLITWHNEPCEAYRLHVEMVERAAQYAARGQREHTSQPSLAEDRRRATAARLAPVLRGILGKDKRAILRFEYSEDVIRFVSGGIVPLERMADVLERGAATPDHILNTKRTPLWIEPEDPFSHDSTVLAAQRAYEQWREQYTEYYHSHTSGEEMLPAVPRVVLVRGLGMFSVGKDSKAAQIASDIYHHTIAIIRAAENIGQYRSLSLKDAFMAEYWPLELYKLTLAPPEKELSRRVALVTGAAGAIGSAIARWFAHAGAHVVCADLDAEGASALAEELTKTNPSNRSIGVEMDVTSESSVIAAYSRISLEYGGVDVVVSNAGIAHSCSLDELTLEDWERSFAVNSTGHFLVAREALKVMKTQATGGSIVFIATKNVTSPGKDFGAYSASKAAEAQLARVLALEGAPFGIRSNIVNPDAVFAGSGLWSSEVRERRAQAQGIDPMELEEFYRKRNLLQVEVTADDVAAAALFYASAQSAKTTGSMLPVDGGLKEAFPR